MRLNEQAIIQAFNSSREYFRILKEQREKNALAEPEVLDLIKDNLKGNVLDAGCGEGSLSRWMAEQNRKVNIYGIDISAIGIEMANSAAKEIDNCIFKSGNLKDMSFEDNFFDLITCQSVLEHVVNYGKALREFYRVLKKGGKLIIRVGNGRRPGQKSLSFLADCILRRNYAIELTPFLTLRHNCLEDHRHNFDVNIIPSDVLTRQLRKIGFRIDYFTTRSYTYKTSDKLAEIGFLRKVIIILSLNLPFFPFTHLGGTTIVMARKV